MVQKTRLIGLVILLLFGINKNNWSQVIFEAEDAVISSGTVEAEHAGYTGDGFVNTENAEGVYVEWIFNSLKAVTDSIGFRYALGKDEIRYMQVYINEALIDTIDFDRSGPGFTDYIYKYVVAPVVIGENKVKLVSINPEGAPNIDHMSVKIDSTVYFKINTNTVGNGIIEVTPVADSFLFGTRVSITATTEGGYSFSGWTGDISKTQSLIHLTVDKDYSITANFKYSLFAFPGAEGFARHATGGRGGTVIEVTNLNDSGNGSLRAAISASGKRTIVFRVSGNIVLNSNLTISNGDVTIAGQTAPGQGITVSGYPIKVSADNVIIRFIRSRLGDVTEVDDDAMKGNKAKNVIIDHCTMSWSVDETASFYDNSNFTMQYCLISESLYNSVHDKGLHGYGGIWGGKGATFHHNLLAHHSSRNPRFCGSRYSNAPELEKVDFRNNVIFNWGKNSVYGAEGGSYNIVNNYYKSGPATSSSVKTRIIAPNEDDGSNSQPAGVWGTFYVDGNYINGYPVYTDNNWGGVHVSGISREDIKSTVEYDFDSVTTHTAQIAFEHVIAQSGACVPFRDELDERIIHETLTGTATYGGVYGAAKGIIDTQDEVGGWPKLVSASAPADTDKDGMPDAWETSRGLDPNNSIDGNGDDNNNGYTNLEEYLNELIAQNTYIIRPLNFMVESSSETEVVLTWEDVLDNESGFLLERRAVGADFELIAKLDENVSTYTDKISELNDYTYRLRSYNSTDTSFYTDTAYVDMITGINSIDAFEEGIRVFPNPFENTVNVEFYLESTGNIEIIMYDITGLKQKAFLNATLDSGNHLFEINTDELINGVYFITIKTKDFLINKKVTKL